MTATFYNGKSQSSYESPKLACYSLEEGGILEGMDGHVRDRHAPTSHWLFSSKLAGVLLRTNAQKHHQIEHRHGEKVLRVQGFLKMSTIPCILQGRGFSCPFYPNSMMVVETLKRCQ